jgi:hypothetical protein
MRTLNSLLVAPQGPGRGPIFVFSEGGAAFGAGGGEAVVGRAPCGGAPGRGSACDLVAPVVGLLDDIAGHTLSAEAERYSRGQRRSPEAGSDRALPMIARTIVTTRARRGTRRPCSTPERLAMRPAA